MAVVVILFSIGYNLTRFFEYRYDYEINDLATTQLRVSKEYHLYYFTVLYMYVRNFYDSLARA